MNTFIDTVAFYALADKTNKYNQRAKNYYNENYKPGRFITSSFVFSESWTLIHHKLGKSAARSFWEKIRSGVIFLQHVTPLDLERAWEISNKYGDQDFSLVDCTNFAMMERLKIFEAFTFDSHFSIFRTKTSQAFICQPI